MKNLFISSAASMVLALFLAGCDRDNVKVYHVENNDTAAPPTAAPATQPSAPMAMPGGMAGDIPIPDNSGLPKLKYNLPQGWKEKPLTQLRVASFEISENGKVADMSVIPLGGSAGGDVPNVNRWRGQVGLQALPEEELLKLAEKIEVAGQPADLYDVAGTAPGCGDEERIVGVILHRDDTAWFFKMTGDADLVEKNKAAFVSFLKTLEFGGLPAPSTMDLSKLPPSHPKIQGMDSAAQPPAAAEVTKPAWIVPAGWQEGELAQFLVARFVIKGDGDAAALVNVSQLEGDGGGLAPNLNRWRKQLGLPPATDEEIAKLPVIDASGVKAVMADFAGTDPRSNKSARLVGVVVPQGNRTWFYKLMGDANVVGVQKDAFIRFVQSAKYPAGQ